jgi:hypothetical protein
MKPNAGYEKERTRPLKRWRGMPRFYFHLINDLDVPDDEGAETAS